MGKKRSVNKSEFKALIFSVRFFIYKKFIRALSKQNPHRTLCKSRIVLFPTHSKVAIKAYSAIITGIRAALETPNISKNAE